MAKRGYTIAIPFDNVRAPGYIGTFNEKGQEIIVDDGECLKKTTKRKPGTVVLGKLTKSSKFFSFLPTSPTQVSNGIDIVSLFVRK